MKGACNTCHCELGLFHLALWPVLLPSSFREHLLITLYGWIYCIFFIAPPPDAQANCTSRLPGTMQLQNVGVLASLYRLTSILLVGYPEAVRCDPVVGLKRSIHLDSGAPFPVLQLLFTLLPHHTRQMSIMWAVLCHTWGGALLTSPSPTLTLQITVIFVSFFYVRVFVGFTSKALKRMHCLAGGWTGRQPGRLSAVLPSWSCFLCPVQGEAAGLGSAAFLLPKQTDFSDWPAGRKLLLTPLFPFTPFYELCHS